MESSGKFDKRLDLVTELVLDRRMVPEERAEIKKMEEHFLSTFEADPAAAKKLLTVGDSPFDRKAPPAQLAAWTLVASEILNLDEALTK